MAAFAFLWLRARGGRETLKVAPDDLPALLDAAEPGRGRLADAPPQIPGRGWRDVLWRTLVDIFRDRIPATAGGVTFFALLAIFPAIGAFVSLYGLFANVHTLSQELAQLAAFVPAGVLTLVAEQMVRLATARSDTLSLAFVLGLVVSIWSANAGTAALFDGLNVVYEETERRNFFTRRLLTYAFTALGVIFLTLTIAILVGIPLALDWLDLRQSLLAPLRWLLLPGLAAAAFGVVYRYGPSRQHARWRWVWPGAAAAAVAWIGVSLLFSVYVNHLAHYDATYGPLGAVVGLMVWIWLSAMVVLIGGELNAELEHQTACDSTTGRPRPIGERGAKMGDTVGTSFHGLRRPGGRLAARLQRQAELAREAKEAPPAEEELVTPARPRGRPAGRPGPRRSGDR